MRADSAIEVISGVIDSLVGPRRDSALIAKYAGESKTAETAPGELSAPYSRPRFRQKTAASTISSPAAPKPDLTILVHAFTVDGGFSWDSLGANANLADSTSLYYDCPIAITGGDTNSFITSNDLVRMKGFLEIKAARIDTVTGAILAWGEEYKGQITDRNGNYGLSSNCLPGFRCREGHTRDSLLYGEEDTYYNKTFAFGAGWELLQITVNAAAPKGGWVECAGCYKDTYYVGFNITRCDQYGIPIFCAEVNDAPITQALKNKMKNL